MSAVTHICPECGGKGRRTVPEGQWPFPSRCPNCDGTGWLDEHGEPIPLEEQTKEPHEDE